MKSFRRFCHNMRERKSFKPQPEELKRGSENLPTIEEALKHGQFLKETKYSINWNAKWKSIPRDVAEKLHQIWIQDFGIPESCLRPIPSTCKALKDQFSHCSNYGNIRPDSQKVWMAKIGTIIEPFKCRCKIELNPSQSEYHHPDCNCQELHKIPKDKLELVYKERERSERIIQSALSEMSENRKIENIKKKMEASLRSQEIWRVKKEKEREAAKPRNPSKNSIFLSQPRPRPNHLNSIKKEVAEELSDDSILSPLISDIEVAQNSIKIESCPDIKEERFE